MAGNRKFHNKFHSANHHTLPSPHIKDSGLDPVASHEFPFMGDYVICGLVSASNNYLLNGPKVKSKHLDTVPFGLPAPAGWNVFRDSMYLDGDLTITGNLTALGELTYLHTQVHATSATEVEVWANNSNGKSTGLLVDQHGTNDIIHIKNDGYSSLLMTGSAENPGWIGINLAALESQDITTPNQRMTIVGSVSVVPDSNELADQLGQQDPGRSGSLYIEGDLHVNDKTFLDQTTVDTTDGKFYVSGNNNDKDANIFDVDVPTELDKTTVDTTDDKFYIHGTGTPGTENPLDVDVPTFLDRTTIDTTDGKFYVHGDNNDKDANIFDVDVPTELDKLTVDTTDDDMLITGTNTLDVDVPTDFEVLVDVDELHVDTTDGDMVVSGGNTLDVDVPTDFEVLVDMDELHVDTTDGDMVVSGGNTLDVDVPVDFETLVDVDELHVDTTDGDMVVSGGNTLDVDVPADFDQHVTLDQVTVDTNDGDFSVITSGNDNKFKIDVRTEITEMLSLEGGLQITGDEPFDVDVQTHLDQVTVDTNDGNFLITTTGDNNILDVDVKSDFSEQITAKDIHVSSPVASGVTFDGNGSFVVANGLVDLHPLKVEIKSITDIDTGVGQLTIKNTETGNWSNRNKAVFQVPTLFDGLTANALEMDVRLTGVKQFTVDLRSIFYNTVDFNGVVNSNDQLNAKDLTVSGNTSLQKTTINTTNGNLLVHGEGISEFSTPVVAYDNVHIKGDLTVDGNAYLSAGEGGLIYIGDFDTDNVIFRADVSSDMLPNIDSTYDLGSEEKRWSHIHSVSSTAEYVRATKGIVADGTLDVDGKTTLDETVIDTTDGSFVVSGDNRSHIHTDLSTYGQVSALGGPWVFGACDLTKIAPHGTVDFDTVENAYEYYVPPHPFQVDCNALFQTGLTARGPVQIGELPSGVVDEMPEPTLEILGNAHLREGNLKIVSDIRHLEDENTLIRFSPDRLEFRVGDAGMLTLTEKPSADGTDLVEVGGPDENVDFKLWRKSETTEPGLYFDSDTGDIEISGSVGIGGSNEAKDVIGDGLDVKGSARVTETLSAGNLIVDYLTVQKDSFGNVGSGGHGGGAAVSTLSGVALSGATTDRYINGEQISFLGTETGIEYDVLNDSQGDIQKLYCFTIVALSADNDKGIHVGDTQSTTYQFAPTYDEFYSQAHVHDVEYGIIHTSENPLASITSVVLSATDVPTSERIVKIIIKPEVDCEYYVHNVLEQTAPKILDTITTGDFKVNGDLSVFGSISGAKDLTIAGPTTLLSATTFEDDVTFNAPVVANDTVNINAQTTVKDLTVDENVHIKGDLRVDGNAYLSAGAGGVINVGDAEQDVVIFNADVDSGINPDDDLTHSLGTSAQRWLDLHVEDVSATGRGHFAGHSYSTSETEYIGNIQHGNDVSPASQLQQGTGSWKYQGDRTTEKHAYDGDLNTVTGEYIAWMMNSTTWTTYTFPTPAAGALNVNWQYYVRSGFASRGTWRVQWRESSSSSWKTAVNLTNKYATPNTYHSRNDVIDTGGLPVYQVRIYMHDIGQGSIRFRVKEIFVNGTSGNTPLHSGDTPIIRWFLRDDNSSDNDDLIQHLLSQQTQEMVNVADVHGSPTVFSFNTLSSPVPVVISNDETTEETVLLYGYGERDPDAGLPIYVGNFTNTHSNSASLTLNEYIKPEEKILVVDGETQLNGDANVRDDLNVGGDTNFGGTLDVQKNAVIHQNLTVNGYVTTLTGRGDFQGDVNISGEAFIANTLYVSGQTTLDDQLDVTSDINSDGDLSIIGNSTLSGNLAVDGDTILNSNLHVKGDLRVDGNAYLSAGSDGVINVGDSNQDNVVFHGDIDSDLLPNHDSTYDLGSENKRWNTIYTRDAVAVGTVSVSGNQKIVDNNSNEPTLAVSGTTFLNGTLTGVDDVYFQNNLQTDGNIRGESDLTITGNTRLSGTACVDDVLHAHTDIRVDGDTYLSGAVTIDGSTSIDDNLLVTGTTKLSGHLEVSDDADIHGHVNVHGLTARDHVHFKNNLQVDVDTNIDNDLTVVGNTTVSGDTTLRSTLQVDDHATFDNNVYIKGDLHVDGNAFLSGGESGYIHVGDTDEDIVSFQADVGSDILPDASSLFNLGSTDKSWNNIYWEGGNSILSNSVYSLINSTSGDNGFANLSAYKDDRFVLRHDQVPDLAITKVHRVSNSSLVITLRSQIFRGDIVLVEDTHDNLIAIADHPTGDYDPQAAEYVGYEKLFAPGDMVRFINGKSGPSVTFTTDDFDDSDTINKFVDTNEKTIWNSVYASVTSTSADWNSVYTSVNNTSADWNDTRTTLSTTSGDWNDTRTTLLATSGDWNDTRTTLGATSGDWNSVYTSVNDTSGDWNSVYTTVDSLSSEWNWTYGIVYHHHQNWEEARLTLNALSADWNSVYTSVEQTSGDWNDTRTTLGATSGDWNSVYTSVNDTSGDWNSVYTTVNSHSSVFTEVEDTSGDWNSVYTSVNDTSGDWNSVYTTVNSHSSVFTEVEDTSGDWNSVYTTVNSHSSVFTEVEDTSGDWNSVYTSVEDTSGTWDSVYTTVNSHSSVFTEVEDTSGDWNSVYTSVEDTSGDWNSVYTSVEDTSGTWDSVYNYINTTSGAEGFATLVNGKLDESQVPNLSLTETIVVTNNSQVSALCDGSLLGPKDIEIGDLVIVTDMGHNLIAMVNNPAGTYNKGFDTFNGFTKLVTPTDYIQTVNSKHGHHVVLNPDDLDDIHTAHKFVTALQRDQWDSTYATVCATSADWNSVYTSVNETSGEWDSVYSFVNGDSATNNTDYNQSTFVNASGDTMTGDLLVSAELSVSGDTTLNSALGVSGSVDVHNTLHVTDDSVFDSNVHIKGDLHVDGNAYLSGGRMAGKAAVYEYGGAFDSYADDEKTKGFDVFSGNYNTGFVATTQYSVGDITLDIYDLQAGDVVELRLWRNVDALDIQWNGTPLGVSTSMSGSKSWNNKTVTAIQGTNTITFRQRNTFTYADGQQLTQVKVNGEVLIDPSILESTGGYINVGDSDEDNVIFHADVDSNIVPDKNDTYSLGTSAKKWSIVHSESASFGVVDIDVANIHEELNVFGVTTLSGKSHEGPGVIITGTPTGITDVNTPGFEDRDGDYMIPDVDITGDVVLHGSLSADEAHIYSLTASNFKAEYQRLVINDGDLELWNGNIRQRGGNVLVEGDIAHIDDENTYIRFEPDSIEFRTHDQRMIQLNEYPFDRDIIKFGDEAFAIDLKIQNATDNNTLFVNGANAYVGIGTDNPAEKFHVYTGQSQFADGDQGGALMVGAGTTDQRVDKQGSIRWNTELNRYEGYLIHDDTWASLNSIGDTDGDTYIDVDAGSYPDSDRMSMYTVGCSAMTIYPNQTVAFAGDIQFDNITVYDTNSVTGPLTATSEFIYLKVNGKDRAIRLWTTPEDTREDIETFHGESVTHIGDECGLGLGGQIPTQTISAQNVLFSPPTQ